MVKSRRRAPLGRQSGVRLGDESPVAGPGFGFGAGQGNIVGVACQGQFEYSETRSALVHLPPPPEDSPQVLGEEPEHLDIDVLRRDGMPLAPGEEVVADRPADQLRPLELRLPVQHFAEGRGY